MSKINALNSSEVAFQGKKTKVDKKSEDKQPKGLKKVFKKLTQPVKDEFKKSYGEDVKPDATLVADYVADGLMKALVAVGGLALVFAKMRKSTNGLTKAAKETFANKSAKVAEGTKDAIEATKTGFFAKLKNVFGEVKSNNLNDANARAAAIKSGESGGAFGAIKSAILKPKEVDNASKLSRFIDKHMGPETKLGKSKLGQKIVARFKSPDATQVDNLAELTKKSLANVGVTETADLVDLGVAGAATALGSGILNEATDKTVDSDDKELATKAKIEQAIRTGEKFVSMAEMFGAA